MIPRPQSLTRLWLVGATAITVVATLTFTLLLSLGFNRSVVTWEAEVGTTIQSFYIEELEQMVTFTEELRSEDVQDYLTGQLDPSRFLFVFDDRQELIYWYWRGDWDVIRPQLLDRDEYLSRQGAVAEAVAGRRLNGTVVGSGEDALFRLLSEAGLVRPVFRPRDPFSEPSGAAEIGWVAAGTTGFSDAGGNRGLLVALTRALTLSVLVTLIVAALVAVGVARLISTNVSSVSHRIAELGRVRRARPEDALASDEEPDLTSAVVARPDAPLSEFGALLEAVERLDERLEREARLRRTWVLDIAHDLRTPLTGMRVQIEGMLDGVISQDSARLRGLLAQVLAHERLTQAFLTLARVESPEYRPAGTTFDLAEAVSNVVERFEDVFSVSSRTVTLVRPSTAPCGDWMLCGDEALVERAVANLLDNAHRHGHGEVLLELTCSEGRLRVVCTNEGPLGEDLHGLLFDRFARSGAAEGHGLGLAIVAAVARAHGGEPIVYEGPQTVSVGFSVTAIHACS